MRRYFHKNPYWLFRIYPGALWEVDTKELVVYLTFDDGPDPEVTPWVLDQLSFYQAKATFFLQGASAVSYPDLVEEVVAHGHAIGNHGFQHYSGWSTSTSAYLEDIARCQQVIRQYSKSRLFRPPYGRLRKGQLKLLLAKKYQPIIWSHLSGDFDQKLNVEKSLKYLREADFGSIIVFHDSFPAKENLAILLPAVLQHFSTLGYQFKPLDFICDS